MTVLLESKSNTPFPEWMRWTFGGIGIYLLGDALRRFLTVKSLSFHALFVGAAVLYACGYRKRIYLTEEGIVRETKTWLNRNREIFPWNELGHVGLAFRRHQMMAFFERDILGWKVLFDRSQEGRLREILKERASGVDITTL
ncbi:MAG: hypothetical protein ACC613_05835 [Synergistales bacterium]